MGAELQNVMPGSQCRGALDTVLWFCTHVKVLSPVFLSALSVLSLVLSLSAKVLF